MRKFARTEIFESLKEEMCLWTGLPSACLYLVPFGCVYRASISSLRTPSFGGLLDEPGERAGGVDSDFLPNAVSCSLSPRVAVHIYSHPFPEEENVICWHHQRNARPIAADFELGYILPRTMVTGGCKQNQRLRGFLSYILLGL